MSDLDIFEEAGRLAREGEPFALATVVWREGPSSSQQGSRAIITIDGEIRGWIGGACAEPAVIREARQVIASGASRLLLLGTPGRFGEAVRRGMRVVPISCQSEGALEVYIEPMVPAPHLVVVGSSPMAHTLAELARALSWRVTRKPGSEFTSADAGEQSLVVVATQGHGDEEAMAQAAAARPAYLGLVGSAKRGAAVLGYLADKGLPAGQLSRVRVPAGLDLGHTSHREIAVAILAELVQLRAAGELATGAASAAREVVQTQPAQTQPAQTQPAEFTDPVCGMTVTAGPAAHPFTCEGITYYFCRAGCRSAFEKDPAAYLAKDSRC